MSTQDANGEILLRDSTHFLEPIFFQVENTIFQVPRQQLERNEVFTSKFKLPPPTDNTAKGTSETNPFPLPEISKKDFSALLHVLYPLSSPSKVELTMEEWVSVLALSDEWEFQIVRDLAIQELSSHKQNSANMITLGVKYSVPLWFIRGCYDFIYRAEGPQPDEIKMIGLERALSIYELRKMDLQGHMYHPIGEIKKIFGEVANCDITDSNNWMSTTSEEAWPPEVIRHSNFNTSMSSGFLKKKKKSRQ